MFVYICVHMFTYIYVYVHVFFFPLRRRHKFEKDHHANHPLNVHGQDHSTWKAKRQRHRRSQRRPNSAVHRYLPLCEIFDSDFSNTLLRPP